MKQLYFSFLCAFLYAGVCAQTVSIISNPGGSSNSVVGPFNYHVSESIYLESEIGVGNFTTLGSEINFVGFDLINQGGPANITNYKIYMINVPLSDTSFIDGAYNNFQYNGGTPVFSGTFPAIGPGFVGVYLNVPFLRTAGTNLKILIERLDGVRHNVPLYRWNTSKGNTSGGATVTSTRRYNDSVAPVLGTSTLTANVFRPAIQLRHSLTNDAQLVQIYTLGKLPIPFAIPHVINALVKNIGLSPYTGNATLNITGVNTFTDSQPITALAPGTTTIVSFTPLTSSQVLNRGIQNVGVSLSLDEDNTNNSLTKTQSVSSNAYSYAPPNAVPDGSTGFNGRTIEYAAKFNTSSPTSVSQVSVNFSSGGQPFQVGIWDATGAGGTPGTLLNSPTTQNSFAGVSNLLISPAVLVSGDFFVGIRQMGNTPLGISYQKEDPIRTQTFYRATPIDSPWVDFAPANKNRFMIEPRLTLANDVGVSTIDTPKAGVNRWCGLNPMVPKATLANFGNTNLPSFNITYEIRNAGNTLVYTNKQMVATASSSTKQQISFAPNFTPDTGIIYTSKVYTDFATDADKTNDTLISVFSYQRIDWGGGSPGEGGYFFANSTQCATAAPSRPKYNWLTPSTPVDVTTLFTPNKNDGKAGPFPLPFAFTFFGMPYNQFWITTNGAVTFSDPGANLVGQPVPTIPTAGGLENYIGGCFADLRFDTSTTDLITDVKVTHGLDMLTNNYVITFNHAHFLKSAQFITFQIVLRPDGTIIVQYDDASSSTGVATIVNKSSVGIENANGTLGLQYHYLLNGGPLFESPLAVGFSSSALILPVTLINFIAVRNGAVNNLSWSTTQEINTFIFAVERSSDGRTFTQIGQVAASGSGALNKYGFTDAKPMKGINYYRLKIIDRDNSFKFSPIQNINNLGVVDVFINPNPVIKTLNIEIKSEKTDKGVITMTDISGKKIYSQLVRIVEGITKITVDMSNITSGSYIIKIALSKETIIRKIDKL